MNIQTKQLEIKRDERGFLAEIFHSEDVHLDSFGLILITTALPGRVKGNHFHKKKTEWYCVIKGKGLLTLVDMQTKEKKEIELSESNLLVEIPPNTAHAIKNIGEEEMYLLAYVDKPFDPKDPDTFSETIVE